MPLSFAIRLTAGELRGRQAAWNGALQNIPDRVRRCTRCGQEGNNVVRCPAINIRLAARSVLPHEGPTSLSGQRRQERW